MELSSCPSFQNEQTSLLLDYLKIQLVLCPMSIVVQQNRQSTLSCGHFQPNQDFCQQCDKAEDLQIWWVESVSSFAQPVFDVLPALNFPFSPQIITAFTEGSASAFFSPFSKSWRTARLKLNRDSVSSHPIHPLPRGLCWEHWAAQWKWAPCPTGSPHAWLLPQVNPVLILLLLQGQTPKPNRLTADLSVTACRAHLQAMTLLFPQQAAQGNVLLKMSLWIKHLDFQENSLA